MPANPRAHARKPVRDLSPVAKSPAEYDEAVPPAAIVPSPATAPAGPATTSLAALGLRVFWMLLGNAALVLSAAKIAENTGSILPELFLAGVTFALIAARYLDVTRFDGRTVHGEPATLAHWKRHASGLVLVSIALWAIARMFGAHD
jgi:hypothetical protein